MTQRSEFHQRRLELKAQLMNWLANRFFSLKETGLDGFLKRTLLKPKKSNKSDNQNSQKFKDRE